MFVRSRMSRDVVYRKSGKEFVIKAGTVSAIDENIVSAKELKSLYGSRIDVISKGFDDVPPIKKAIKPAKKLNVEAPKQKPEPPKKLDNALIDNILDELKDEEKEKEEAPKKVTRKRAASKKTSATKKAARKNSKKS